MKALKIIAVILFLISGIMFYQGYDKMMNYTNSDSYYVDNHNAYVGGDAYNYIINGTYATAFFVLGVGGVISGFVCIGIATIVEAIRNIELKQKVEGDLFDDQLPPL